MVYAFDSLAFARRLEQSGIPRDTANAHAEAVRDYIMSDLVTKSDLNATADMLRSETITQIDLLRHDMSNRFQVVDSRLDKMTGLIESGFEGIEDEMDSRIANMRWEVGKSFDKLSGCVDLRFQSVDSRLDLMRADMVAGFNRADSRMDKLALQMTVRLGGMIIAGVAALGFVLAYLDKV